MNSPVPPPSLVAQWAGEAVRGCHSGLGNAGLCPWIPWASWVPHPGLPPCPGGQLVGTGLLSISFLSWTDSLPVQRI